VKVGQAPCAQVAENPYAHADCTEPVVYSHEGRHPLLRACATRLRSVLRRYDAQDALLPRRWPSRSCARTITSLLRVGFDQFVIGNRITWSTWCAEGGRGLVSPGPRRHLRESTRTSRTTNKRVLACLLDGATHVPSATASILLDGDVVVRSLGVVEEADRSAARTALAVALGRREIGPRGRSRSPRTTRTACSAIGKHVPVRSAMGEFGRHRAVSARVVERSCSPRLHQRVTRQAAWSNELLRGPRSRQIIDSRRPRLYGRRPSARCTPTEIDHGRGSQLTPAKRAGSRQRPAFRRPGRRPCASRVVILGRPDRGPRLCEAPPTSLRLAPCDGFPDLPGRSRGMRPAPARRNSIIGGPRRRGCAPRSR